MSLLLSIVVSEIPRAIALLRTVAMANGKTEYRLAFGADIYSEPVSNLRARIADIIERDDFGSLMIEENVVSAAGIDFIMPESEIARIIKDAGFQPRRRYQDYTLVENGDGGCPCCQRQLLVS